MREEGGGETGRIKREMEAPNRNEGGEWERIGEETETQILQMPMEGGE